MQKEKKRKRNKLRNRSSENQVYISSFPTFPPFPPFPTFRSFTVPSAAPNFFVKSAGGEGLRVTWRPLLPLAARGVVTKYQVTCRPRTPGHSPIVVELDAEQTEYIFTGESRFCM